jgi:hypothetical protein
LNSSTDAFEMPLYSDSSFFAVPVAASDASLTLPSVTFSVKLAPLLIAMPSGPAAAVVVLDVSGINPDDSSLITS